MPLIHGGPGSGMPSSRAVFRILGATGLLAGAIASWRGSWASASMLGGLGLALLAYSLLLSPAIRPRWQERGVLALGMLGVALGMVGAYLLL